MRFLADENFPYDAVQALHDDGHDIAWVRTDAPGISDRQVLARAMATHRILLTFDKDFGELAFHAGLPAACGIILCPYHRAFFRAGGPDHSVCCKDTNRLGRAFFRS